MSMFDASTVVNLLGILGAFLLMITPYATFKMIKEHEFSVAPLVILIFGLALFIGWISY